MITTRDVRSYLRLFFRHYSDTKGISDNAKNYQVKVIQKFLKEEQRPHTYSEILQFLYYDDLFFGGECNIREDGMVDLAYRIMDIEAARYFGRPLSDKPDKEIGWEPQDRYEYGGHRYTPVDYQGLFPTITHSYHDVELGGNNENQTYRGRNHVQYDKEKTSDLHPSSSDKCHKNRKEDQEEQEHTVA